MVLCSKRKFIYRTRLVRVYSILRHEPNYCVICIFARNRYRTWLLSRNEEVSSRNASLLVDFLRLYVLERAILGALVRVSITWKASSTAFMPFVPFTYLVRISFLRERIRKFY